ncbi:MAG: sigma 54-interacting transcriptional regulator [Candidatus Binatia bacterium]|nr:sigma 54-interacting transcriptional regulator [Candidatus Binatia bacterium]
MERLKIGVVDQSPSIRETVAIVLREHQVTRFTPEAFANLPTPFPGDLLIVERGAVSAETLARLAPDVPVLWIQSEGDRSAESSALPRLFQPYVLRRRVREIWAAAQEDRRELLLPSFPPPLLPPEVAGIVRGALRTRLPTLIHGEPGTGKLRLARAMHRASGNATVEIVNASNLTPQFVQGLKKGASASGVTVCVRGLDTGCSSTEAGLAEMLDWMRTANRRVWLISLSRTGPDELAERTHANPTLLHQLAVFSIPLPPLRERAAELPHIIAAESARLSSLLHVSPATFTPQAWDLLKHYLWLGNLSELEAVLARTMTLVRHRPIGAEEILFEPPDRPRSLASPGLGSADETRNASVVGASATTRQLEVLLNELAHELKNPLVTIKTISQHLERLLNDETGREQIAQLAGEAVNRMDQLLENLLRFARFGPPAPQQTSVNAVLAPALAELAPVLSEKQIVLHYVPAEGNTISGDPAQLSFALENLLRAVLRDLDEGATLAIEPSRNSTAVEIRFPQPHTGVVERLGGYVDLQPVARAGIEPLGFLIARSLLERNGAKLDERREGTVRRILVAFTSATKMADAYDEETHSHRG